MMSWRAWSGLLFLAALWGGSFLFMRIGAPAFGPVPLVGLRLTLAALPLLPILWLRGGLAEWRQHAWPILVAGLFNCTLPFCLIAWAELSMSAGLGSVLNATTPLMATLWAVPLAGERLSAARLAGLALGFVGVYALMQQEHAAATGGAASWLPVAAMLLATASYGRGVHYVKQRLAGVPALTVTAGSLASSGLLLLPLTIWFWPSQPVPALAWSAVGALALLSTTLAFLLFYRLIARVGATQASAVAYLIPLFGVLWGALFLDEAVYAGMLLGAALILAGVGLIHRPAPAPATVAVKS